MSTINKKLLGFIFNASALNLSSATFKGNVNVIYGFNAGGTGYISFKPTSNFNSLTQLQPDGVYIVDAKTTGFDIPGALLVAANNATTIALPSNELIPALENYWFNANIQRVNNASKKIHAARARLLVDLLGNTSVTLRAFSTSGPILVIDEGTGVSYPLSANATESDFSLSNLSGTYLSIYTGSNQRTYDAGDVDGSAITKIQFAGGGIGRLISPVLPAVAGAMACDSIGIGSGSSSPFAKGFGALLNTRGRSLTLLGYGSAQGYVFLDPANRTTVFAQIRAATAGAVRKYFIYQLGSNDALGASGGGSAPLADYMSRFAAFLPAFRAEFPDVAFILLTPVNRDGEANANQYGWTMQQLRDSEAAEATKYSWITIIDGKNIIQPSDRADFAHPNDSGHAKIYNAILPVVSNLTIIANPTGTPVIYHADGADFVKSGNWGTSASYGGEAYSNDVNAYGTFVFSGTSLIIRGNVDIHTRMKLTLDGSSVYIDGTTLPAANDSIMYTFNNLANGPHTLRVEKSTTDNYYMSVTSLTVY